MTTDYKVTELRFLPFALEASCQSPNMRKQYCRLYAWQFPVGRVQSLQRHVEASTMRRLNFFPDHH